MDPAVGQALKRYNNDATRLMDILLEIQEKLSHIPVEAVGAIAQATGQTSVDVEQTISFYHFFSHEPRGRYTVYLNDSVVAQMNGREEIRKAFEREAECICGDVSPDGLIGLYNTSCIGMNDQEPAALINGVVFTRLTPARIKELVSDMRAGKSVEEMRVEGVGDGQNSTMRAMVTNNIHRRGAVILADYTPGDATKKYVDMTPQAVIDLIKDSAIRGRGGAGFPTGLKWELCSKAPGDKRYIFCNADEGEPGTFKDRVILTELAPLVFEGMALAGFAVGSDEGILYLRYEYAYMREHLEAVLADMRKKNLLGKGIGGRTDFDFDIRIQFGAGAYVCGEESALIESAEGKRGEPRDRPPFPVESGYLGKPTVVNNVETLCAAAKIVLNGSAWYRGLGTEKSSGTKVLSISGDCATPGIYEIEWGFSINDLLATVGATDTQAVQIAGPSGSLIGPEDFNRVLAYEDLATGGSIIIFNSSRDLLRDVVRGFTEFFIEESCGSCVPCRAMTVVLRNKLDKILDGHGVAADLDDLEAWASIMPANRCGLGQTAANPISTSLKNFRHLYTSLLRKDTDFDSGFDLAAAVAASCKAADRIPNLEPAHS